MFTIVALQTPQGDSHYSDAAELSGYTHPDIEQFRALRHNNDFYQVWNTTSGGFDNMCNCRCLAQNEVRFPLMSNADELENIPEKRPAESGSEHKLLSSQMQSFQDVRHMSRLAD